MTRSDKEGHTDTVVCPLKSFLFVPASRPERIPKALASGAGMVIVDLEDAVNEADKEVARAALDAFLDDHPEAGVLVRINARDSRHFHEDVALCQRHSGVTGIVLPKAESAEDIRLLTCTGKPVIPLIETAAGLLALSDIAGAEGVERLSYGGLDLSENLGLEGNTEGADTIIDQCRYQLLVHSRAAGLMPPVETVFPVFDDAEAVKQRARRARNMGFGGMLCIHPRQIGPVREGFSPEPGQVAWARKVVEAAETASGAFRIDGQMVDPPVIAMARNILRRVD